MSRTPATGNSDVHPASELRGDASSAETVAPRRRAAGVLRLPVGARAALLTVGVAGSMGATVIAVQALGFEPRQAVLLSMPVGVVLGFCFALVLILVPEWRAAADRRELIKCLTELARVDREAPFGSLLLHGKDHELHELSQAIHSALLSAHRDRLEASHLRRELDARVQRKTKAVVAELSKISNTDELTGLLNRRGFDSAFVSLFDAAVSSGEELSLLAIDMDYFKQLNDSCGHDKGDMALRAAGEVMRAQLREGDVAGRVGGDEFLIALRGTGSAQAQTVAKRLLDLFQRSPHAAGIPARWPSFSIGIACADEHQADSAESLRKLADEALYEVKRAGRSNFRVYSPRKGGPPPQKRAA